MADYYPDEPGAKGSGITADTSQAVAAAIAPTVRFLRRIALEGLARLRAATAEEVCALLWRDRAAIQPRLSELRRMGLVEPNGERRRNASGKSAAVWRLTAAGRAVLNGGGE